MAKKILIADDEEEIVDLFKMMFETAGYNTVSTNFGSAIPELIKKEKPDLIIMDVLMPGIDGYSLQVQFAEDETAKNIPIIVVTALPATRSLFEKFSQVKLFVNKPFNTDEILKKIKEILGE